MLAQTDAPRPPFAAGRNHFAAGETMAVGPSRFRRAGALPIHDRTESCPGRAGCWANDVWRALAGDDCAWQHIRSAGVSTALQSMRRGFGGPVRDRNTDGFPLCLKQKHPDGFLPCKILPATADVPKQPPSGAVRQIRILFDRQERNVTQFGCATEPRAVLNMEKNR